MSRFIICFAFLTGCASLQYRPYSASEVVPIKVHEHLVGTVEATGPWRNRGLKLIEVQNLSDRAGVGLVSCEPLRLPDLQFDLSPHGVGYTYVEVSRRWSSSVDPFDTVCHAR
jgi:hypothetical protein